MARTVHPMAAYQRRVVDSQLDSLLLSLTALSLDGPKGVGKTTTARRRAGSIFQLDDPGILEIVLAEPDRLTRATPPIVIDEWQLYPASWDVVRRSVDNDHSPGRFILTGSATPTNRPTHSGAGRTAPIRMRPLTLVERGVGTPTVSLTELLNGSRPALRGTTDITLSDYTEEIIAGGFPGMRHSSLRAQRTALDGYLERIVDRDLPELGVEVRNPNTLRRWLRTYAAATATTTSYEKIGDASSGGEETKPAKRTASAYREALERIWILDSVPAWAPTNSHLNRLIASPKHHLADPALAARLVGADAASLLRGEGALTVARDGTFLGSLFESLATLCVRVFAQDAEARTSHFRTRGGEHEVDLIIVRDDQRVVAIETKLTDNVTNDDVAHLTWLRQKLGDTLLDAIVLSTGREAYRRSDGIGVVPLSLLGP
jgi:predicted AAA+ superfamily ATPase